MSTVLETIDLSKTYSGGVEALKSLNLKIQKGESLGFLGPNGAGKTTTIQIILNLLKPSSGKVRLFDQPMQGQERELLRDVGALVGMPGYYDRITADDILNYVARTFKMDKRETTIRKNEVLDEVGLTHARYRKIGTFSTGMKRRLSVAQILIHDPEFVILDEPTNGLDPKGVREVRDLIRNINKMGKTVFLTTHNLTEADEINDRVIFLDKGVVVGDEKLTDLKRKLGSRQIEIKTLQPLNDSQLKFIESIDHVVNITKADKLLVEYEGDQSNINSILNDLVQEKLPVYSFTPKTLTLEDIYLKIFNESPQEGAA